MEESQLAELSQHYDAYMLGALKNPETQRAMVMYKAIARTLYTLESDAIKAKFTFEKYVAFVVNVEVLAYLEKRQSTHPTVLPERST
jgi:hypothetical protein